MKKYDVTGMSCAACSARVEKAVSAVSGVTNCSVNLLTNSMTVEGSATDKEIISAVKKAGYGARVSEGEISLDNSGEIKALKRRFVLSVAFLLILMYISMGHTMWNWPLPSVFSKNHLLLGIIQLVLSLAVMVINRKFFINGWHGIKNKSPNMDTLVAMGSGAAFIYSMYLVILIAKTNDHHLAMEYMHGLYFESAAMILALITVGKMLEAYSKGRTTSAVKSLMELSPKTATVIRDGKETVIPSDEIKIGDIFAVKAGERIPADGIVKEGGGAVDEASLTGESIPVDKSEGDKVSASTVNKDGYMLCVAEKVGKDTAINQIIKMVNDASASKAPIAKAADKVSGVFVPSVIVIAIITLTVWLLLGRSVGFALEKAISVLVISCPCALGLATPVAIMVGSGVGAKNGILFKTAEALEITGKIKTVALDKTGTVTSGIMSVTDILPEEGFTKKELLTLAYSLEKKSEHPIAMAIVEKAKEEGIEALEIKEFTVEAGRGISGIYEGKKIRGGKSGYTNASSIKDVELAEQGKTPVYFTVNGENMGIIAVSDTLKEDSPGAVSELKKMGVNVVMITGDNEKTAEAIAKSAYINEVVAGVLPDEKGNAVLKLKNHGYVAMAGDGINDAPALTIADVGIAVGAGTDVAIDSADIVLMKSKLSDIPRLIRLSRSTLRNIHENLFWAFIYNTIGIPLAAGIFSKWGIELTPMFAAFAMSLSSFCVVMNALRLNFVKI